jgi:superfamily II DNA or RNA helicase
MAEALIAQGQTWRDPLAWYQPFGSESDALQHQVIDLAGDPQLVTIYLYRVFGQPTPESTCTCRAAQCSHAAAVLLALQQMLAWPLAMTPLQRWRRGLDTSPEAPLHRASTVPLAALDLICLVCTESERRPSSLAACLVLVRSAGDLHHREQWISVEQSPPHVLSPQAIAWQAQLSNGPRGVSRSGPAFRLVGSSGAALFRELLQSGICYHADTLRKLHEGPDFQPEWQWSHDSDAQARLTLVLPNDTTHLVDLDGLHCLDESSGEFSRLTLAMSAWRMIEHMPPIPPNESELRATWPPHGVLADIPPPPPPPALRVVHAELAPILVIGASRDRQHNDWVFHFTAWADYGGVRLPLARDPWQTQTTRRAAAEYVTIDRDIERELSALASMGEAHIEDLGKALPGGGRTLSPPPPSHSLAHRQHLRGGADTFSALEVIGQSLARFGFHLEYDPDLPFTVFPEDTELRATLGESKQVGWTQFELAAPFAGGEINVLPIILEGLKRKAFSLTPSSSELPNAHWLAPIGAQEFLPLALSRLREWFAPLVDSVSGPQLIKPALDVSRVQALALTASLQADGIRISGTQAVPIAETLAALRSAQQSSALVKTPASFRGVLRGYQLEGLQWLQALRQSRLGGVLADDMGLGKTVQVIAHLLLEFESGRLERPALIIVPTSLVFNWLDEIERFAPDLRCVNFSGADRLSRRDTLAHAHVVIITYALLPTELDWLDGIDYSMLVLDEAQWIKNPLTQTARAVRRLRASHRLAVTGTPLENHLGELWAHMDAVLPGLLGDYRTFNRRFRVPIERHEDDARMVILRNRVAPFLLRRIKSVVAPELPPKTETVLRIAMAEDQRRLYESLRLSLSKQVRDALASYREEQSRIIVLSALLRLRQVCCDPRLLGDSPASAGSAKLEALLDLIRALREEDCHVLVFSQFASMLKLIAEALTRAKCSHVMLTGQTPARASLVRRFQSGKVPILLASLKAGGVGLNLTVADAVIHYDPWWNPAVEMQAIDRAHRIGREQPVLVYKLICEDTIEEKIENMKERKSQLAQSLWHDGYSSTTGLADLDIRALFDLSAPA